jgi:hypothetical protein
MDIGFDVKKEYGHLTAVTCLNCNVVYISGFGVDWMSSALVWSTDGNSDLGDKQNSQNPLEFGQDECEV